MFIFFYALLPAVTEEIFFRGLILNSFKGVKNLAVAVVLSGLCFALYHVNFTQFFYQFIYGVMLALLVAVSGSVIPAIFAHFINNLAVILFTYFAVEINLFNPLFISLGIIVTVLSALALIFLNKKKSAEKSEKTDGVGKFILFAAVGGAFCLLLAIGNLFNI